MADNKNWTKEKKQEMILKRKKTQEQKKEALDVLKRNPQFANPKMWEKVDLKTIRAITNALKMAESLATKRRIKEIKEELVTLEGK